MSLSPTYTPTATSVLAELRDRLPERYGVRVVWFDDDDMIIGSKVVRTHSALDRLMRSIPMTSPYTIDPVAR